MNTRVTKIGTSKIPYIVALFVVLGLRSVGYCQPTFDNLWYVDASATGADDGSSWDDAFVDLQDALAEADESIGTDQIWVAAGSYYPDGGTDDQTDSFYLLNSTALYGGFLGTESVRAQRNPEMNVTILSGDIGDPGEADDNSYHVVRAISTNSSAVLNGFTITQGVAPSDEYGSGMLVEGANPIIARCIFLANGDGNSGYGGGLALRGAPNKSETHLVNCSFLGNRTGGHAGGVFMETIGANNFSVRFVNCVFSGNTVDTHGGAFCAHGPFVYLNNCTLYGNDGNGTGDGFAAFSSVAVRNCIIWDNEPEQVFDSDEYVSIYFSDIEDGWEGAGSDNIDEDPVFCDADGPDDELGTADDNLRLDDNSPCLDVGDDEIYMPDVADLDDDGDTGETVPWDRDLDRESAKPYTHWGRSFDVVNGPEDPPTKIDMGAYENQHIADCKWDIASNATPAAPPDGDVGNPDLLKLLADWGACPGCGADFDCDLQVGNLDYAALMTSWGECPGGESAQGGGSELDDAIWALGFEDVASYITWLEEEASDEDGYISAAALAALLSA